MALLTLEESLKFLQDVLHMNVTSEDVPLSSSYSTTVARYTKVSFLETVLRAFLHREPFQSLCLMSEDIPKRHRPSWEEIKKDMFLGRGGLCYSQNTFMFALLASLGYDVSMTHSTVITGMTCPDNHLVLLISDLVTPGDLHLADVGIGYCIPHAVPLDFTTESSIYTNSFLSYKFVRESSEKIVFNKLVEKPSSQPTESRQNVNHLPQGQPTCQDSSRVLQCEKASSDLDSSVGSSEQNMPDTALTKCAGAKEVSTSFEVGDRSKRGKVGSFDNIDADSDTKLGQVSSESHQVNHKNDAEDVPEKKQKLIAENNDKDNQNTQRFQWHKLFFFNPTKKFKNLEEFFQCFDLCFTDITKLSFHTSPRAMAWPNGRFLGLANSKLIQEGDNGKLIKTDLLHTNFSQSVRENAVRNEEYRSGENCLKVEETSTKRVSSPKNSDKHNSTKPIAQVDECIKNEGELKGCAGGLEGVTVHSDLQPLFRAYQHYFPQFSPQLVAAALENWRLSESLHPLPHHLQ